MPISLQSYRCLKRSVSGFNWFIHLVHGCRDERFGKNCLGTITVTTSSTRDRSTTGENNLLLFIVATRLHAIIDDNTDNRICQGDPGISGNWFLFRCQHTQPDCRWGPNDWSRERQSDRGPVYKRIASPKSERYLHCAKSVPSRQRQPKHQLKHGAILYNEAEVFSLSIRNPNGRPMLQFDWRIHSGLILARSRCLKILQSDRVWFSVLFYK